MFCSAAQTCCTCWVCTLLCAYPVRRHQSHTTSISAAATPSLPLNIPSTTTTQQAGLLAPARLHHTRPFTVAAPSAMLLTAPQHMHTTHNQPDTAPQQKQPLQHVAEPSQRDTSVVQAITPARRISHYFTPHASATLRSLLATGVPSIRMCRAGQPPNYGCL
jgi:hypothetical protein